MIYKCNRQIATQRLRHEAVNRFVQVRRFVSTGSHYEKGHLLRKIIDRLSGTRVGKPERLGQLGDARQRSLGALGDAVIEGRDIGTVVAPGAEVKVFLVADEAERARRRTADRTGIGAEALATELRRRDERDAVNTYPADDAVVLDTTDLSVEDVVGRIEALVEERRA